MNKTWLAAALSIVLILIFSMVVFMPETNDLNPVKEVKVTVISGSVDVENAGSSQLETLNGGDSVTIHEQEGMQRDGSISSPSPTPIPINDYTESTLKTSTLIVTAVDTANQPVASVPVAIETKRGKQQYSLDEHGRVEIPNLLRGEVVVHFHAPAFFHINPATMVLNEDKHELSLSLPRKGSIRARIVGNGFDPVADASTELVPGDRIPTLAETDLEAKTSDDEGLLRYEPVATGEYVLLVTAPPYLPHRSNIDAGVDPELQTVRLSETSMLTVHVKDEESEPVFAAKVTLKSVGGGQGITLIQETSQVTGDAVFQDLPPGTYMVQAVHDWFNDDGEGTHEFEITYDKHNINLTLTHREFTITGKVLDQASGTPVEDAEVVAFSEEKIKQTNISSPVYNTFKHEFNLKPDAQSKTGADGQYRLENLRGGTYTLGISPRKDYVFVPFTKDWVLGGEGYNPVVLLSDQSEVEGVDIQLLRSWTVSGQVMMEDGSTLPDATVRVLANYKGGDHYAYIHRYGYGDGNIMQRVEVNDDGEYTAEGNSYVFGNDLKIFLNANHKIYRGAYEGLGKKIEVDPGETKTAVDLIFESKIEISGFIRNVENQSLEDAKISMSLIGGRSTHFSYSDESGYYHTALQPGEFSISASKSGYKSQIIKETMTLETGQNKKQFDFYLEEGDEGFEGIITDEDNIPIPNKRVILSYSTSMFEGWDEEISDEQGRFRLEARAMAIPDEEILFTISSRADAHFEEVIYQTSERGAKNIHLTAKKFDDYSSVSGFVVDQNNQPVTQFDLKLVPTQIRSYQENYATLYQWQPITHPNGAFSIENVPAVDGPFLVSARTQTMAPGFSDPVTLYKDLPVTNVAVQIQEKTFSLHGVVQSNGAPYQNANILFIPNNPVEFDSLDSQGNGYSQLNLSFPNAVTLEDGAFVLEGVPVRGGQIMVRPRWDDQEHQITMINVDPAQPHSSVDVGIVVIDASNK